MVRQMTDQSSPDLFWKNSPVSSDFLCSLAPLPCPPLTRTPLSLTLRPNPISHFYPLAATMVIPVVVNDRK